MSLHSDLTIDASKFKPEAISESTRKMNDGLMQLTKGDASWWEVGPAKYREMRRTGKTALPKPVFLDSAETISVPSREEGRDIPCRLVKPDAEGQVKAIYLHAHAGGWTLMSEDTQDPLLKAIANAATVAVISVGYRLAPEHPFPQGAEDCFDAAEWLIEHSESKFGASFQFVGGESAGGHLAMLTALYLLKHKPSFKLSGLVLNFGAFDLSFLPQVYNYKTPHVLILDRETMEHFAEAVWPGLSAVQRRDPSISPFYENLRGLELPPALFTCGTEDCLLDDSVMMATKWQMSGGDAILKIFPGAPHGFILFPPDASENAKEGLAILGEFLRDRIGGDGK